MEAAAVVRPCASIPPDSHVEAREAVQGEVGVAWSLLSSIEGWNRNGGRGGGWGGMAPCLFSIPTVCEGSTYGGEGTRLVTSREERGNLHGKVPSSGAIDPLIGSVWAVPCVTLRAAPRRTWWVAGPFHKMGHRTSPSPVVVVNGPASRWTPSPTGVEEKETNEEDGAVAAVVERWNTPPLDVAQTFLGKWEEGACSSNTSGDTRRM